MRVLFTLTLGFFSFVSFAQQPTVGLTSYDTLSYDAYTLFAPFASTETYLIDNCGHIVNSWKSDYPPGAIAYLKPNGNLIRTAHVQNPVFDIAGGNGGRLEEYDWEGNLVWYMNLTTDSFSQHHDIELLPNGNILALIWKLVPRATAIAAGKNPTQFQEDTWQESVWEIKPNAISGGSIVWSWNVMNHIVQDFNPKAQNFGVISEHPELINFNSPIITNDIDWLHFNSIDYNSDLDQIIVSCLGLSELYIIDHSTSNSESQGHIGGQQNMGGDFLYRYGNPMAYGRGTAINQVSFKQHDAQWIPKGYTNAGKIVFFNNGGAREYSSIDMMSPYTNLDGSYKIEGGSTFGPSFPDWSYTAQNKTAFFSVNMSGVQPLSNGNLLITESTKGHIFELDKNQNIVWSYVNPISGSGIVKQGDNPRANAVFRGFKYGVNTEAFNGRTIKPGIRLEIDPWPIFCDDTTATNQDTVGTGFASGLSQTKSLVFPNPATNVLSVSHANTLNAFAIVSLNGELVLKKEVAQNVNTASLDVTFLTPGMYTLVLYTKDDIQYHQRFIKL